MSTNKLNFDDFAKRYFNGEEFLFMYKNLSLHFKIIDGAHILEYSDGYKVKQMQLLAIDYLYHVTMNSQTILDFWDKFEQIKIK